MTFFDPTPKPEHRCAPPRHATQDGWACECGRAYVRETLPARDVNPGERPWQWRRSPEHDGSAS